MSRSFGIARCVRRGETASGIAEHWARGVREAGGRCHDHMGAQVVGQLLVYLFGQLTLGSTISGLPAQSSSVWPV